MITSCGGKGALPAKQVLEDSTGLDVVTLVVDVCCDGDVIKLRLEPETRNTE
jgi:hypothetical protein